MIKNDRNMGSSANLASRKAWKEKQELSWDMAKKGKQ